MYERHHSASIIVACSGPNETSFIDSPFGKIRSKDGADLKFTSNDAKGIFSKWENSNVPENTSKYLENPTLLELISAIKDVSEVLAEFPQGQTGIDFYYSGHGALADGGWVLRDKNFTAEMLCEEMSKFIIPRAGIRGISLMLDSCYSGAFLINLMVHLENLANLRLFDAQTSCLHNEKAYESKMLGHGFFTYTKLFPSNKHVPIEEFKDAIIKKDFKTQTMHLQGLVSSMVCPTFFLTQGRQTVLDVMKGNFINVKGHGDYTLGGEDGNDSIDFGTIALELQKIKNSE